MTLGRCKLLNIIDLGFAILSIKYPVHLIDLLSLDSSCSLAILICLNFIAYRGDEASSLRAIARNCQSSALYSSEANYVIWSCQAPFGEWLITSVSLSNILSLLSLFSICKRQ